MQTSQRHPSPLARPALKNANGLRAPVLLPKAATGKPAPALATFMKILAPGMLTAALWTQIWLGFWSALLVAIAVLVFVIALPKLIGETGKNSGWAKQVSFGEKIWLNRLFLPVPASDSARLTTLYLVFWMGSLIALLGGFLTSPILSLTGLIVAYAAQFVSFGKLVQLYRTMKEKTPLYRFWTAVPQNDNLPKSLARSNRN
ncbi:hypothetical protein LAB1_45150 [Roseibium sp. LAB1]